MKCTRDIQERDGEIEQDIGQRKNMIKVRIDGIKGKGERKNSQWIAHKDTQPSRRSPNYGAELQDIIERSMLASGT